MRDFKNKGVRPGMCDEQTKQFIWAAEEDKIVMNIWETDTSARQQQQHAIVESDTSLFGLHNNHFYLVLMRFIVAFQQTFLWISLFNDSPFYFLQFQTVDVFSALFFFSRYISLLLRRIGVRQTAFFYRHKKKYSLLTNTSIRCGIDDDAILSFR